MPLSRPARSARQPRLVVDGRPLEVPVEVADTLLTRGVGSLGRQRISGCLLLTPCASVHGVGMRRALQVGYLDAAGVVIDVAVLRPGRVHRRRRGARAVLEAELGALTQWGVTPGSTVTLGYAELDGSGSAAERPGRPEPAPDAAGAPSVSERSERGSRLRSIAAGVAALATLAA